eukprot:3099734-Prymnesium_polylepis.1
MGRMEPAKDCIKLKMIEDFMRLHTAEIFASIGAVLMARPRLRRSAARRRPTAPSSRSRAPTSRWYRGSSSMRTRRRSSPSRTTR